MRLRVLLGVGRGQGLGFDKVTVSLSFHGLHGYLVGIRACAHALGLTW